MAQRRGQYRKTPKRREQILDAAVEVFAETGYTAGSVNEIARRVGMTQTGILHHFSGGKAELLRAVLERRDVQATSLLAGRRGVDKLAALLEISRRQQPGMVQLYKILSAEATRPDHPAHDYFAGRFQEILREVETAYVQAAEEGHLRAGVDPAAAALDTLVAVEGAEAVWLGGVDVDVVELSRRQIEQHLTVPVPPLRQGEQEAPEEASASTDASDALPAS